jgi:hypothetical protein
MAKFPVDAPKTRVIRTLELLGFTIVREREHIVMLRENNDGTRTPLTIPTEGVTCKLKSLSYKALSLIMFKKITTVQRQSLTKNEAYSFC